MKRLIPMLIAIAPSTALAEAQAVHEYDVLLQEATELVRGLRDKSRDDVVMLRSVEGDRPELVKKAITEALLAAGVHTANTREEIEALRAHYRRQGIDIYKNRAFQKLLTASLDARLSIDAEHRCERTGARELTCVLWLRAFLPTTLVYAAHRSYTVDAPAIRAASPSPRAPNGDHAPFLWLLAGYALLPALLHRLDIQFRRADGRWRSAAYLPIHTVGNRLVVFLATISFMVVGPTWFERWVMTLEHDPRAELLNFLITLATMSVLAFAGSVVFSLWPLTRGEHRHRATFRELFVLHPDFWTKRIEGQN